MKMNPNLENIIPQGPASILETGKRYLILPKVEEPQSIDRIQEAMTEMHVGEKYPLINYCGVSIVIAILTPQTERIIIHGPRDFSFTYTQFEQALGTLMLYTTASWN